MRQKMAVERFASYTTMWLRMWLILSQGAVSTSLVAQYDTALEPHSADTSFIQTL